MGTAGVSLTACFAAFLGFEFCVGVYFPTVGVLKSEIVPEHVRGTMYNIYRVPLNAVVVGLLLTNISMMMCFQICALLITVAPTNKETPLPEVYQEVSMKEI